MQLTRTYPAPIDDVWAALTVSPRLGRWLGTFTGEGGTVELTVTGEVDAGGEIAPPTPVTVHECTAPSRLVVEFPQDEDSWTMAVDLAEADGATRLQLTQDPPGEAPDIEAGWAWYLDRLGASLTGAPMPDWSAYAPG